MARFFIRSDKMYQLSHVSEKCRHKSEGVLLRVGFQEDMDL